MFYAIIAAITAVALVAVYLMMPTPTMDNASSPGLDDFNYPTNSNGRVVPEVFGTCHIRGNVIWYGDLRRKEIRS